MDHSNSSHLRPLPRVLETEVAGAVNVSKWLSHGRSINRWPVRSLASFPGSGADRRYSSTVQYQEAASVLVPPNSDPIYARS
jgi:hypothetical protein